MTTKNYIYAIVLVIVFATIIHEGTSIICYECISIINPDCANNVENIKPIDCSNKTNILSMNQEINLFRNNHQSRDSEYTYSTCVKIVAQAQFLPGKINGTEIAVQRSCFPDKAVGLVLCNQAKLNKNVTVCDVCTDNECNSSSTITFKIISILFPLVIALYLA